MTNTTTGRRIVLTSAEGFGSHFLVPVGKLPRVRALLDEHPLPYWVDHFAISLNGAEAVIAVNFGRKVDPQQVQSLLDLDSDSGEIRDGRSGAS